MYCNCCGKNVTDEFKFCPHCGNTIGNAGMEVAVAQKNERSLATRILICTAIIIVFMLVKLSMKLLGISGFFPSMIFFSALSYCVYWGWKK